MINYSHDGTKATIYFNHRTIGVGGYELKADASGKTKEETADAVAGFIKELISTLEKYETEAVKELK